MTKKTYSQEANEKILEFISGFIDGIRDSYEKGASYRKKNVDLKSVQEMLEFKDKRIKERLEIIHEMSRDSKNVTVPMIRKEAELLKELI